MRDQRFEQARVEALARGIRDHGVARGERGDRGAGFAGDHARAGAFGLRAGGEAEREAVQARR